MEILLTNEERAYLQSYLKFSRWGFETVERSGIHLHFYRNGFLFDLLCVKDTCFKGLDQGVYYTPAELGLED